MLLHHAYVPLSASYICYDTNLIIPVKFPQRPIKLIEYKLENWCINGSAHTVKYPSMTIFGKVWCVYGRTHQLNGPSDFSEWITSANRWTIRGLIHRTDGKQLRTSWPSPVTYAWYVDGAPVPRSHARWRGMQLFLSNFFRQIVIQFVPIEDCFVIGSNVSK